MAKYVVDLESGSVICDSIEDTLALVKESVRIKNVELETSGKLAASMKWDISVKGWNFEKDVRDLLHERMPEFLKNRKTFTRVEVARVMGINLDKAGDWVRLSFKNCLGNVSIQKKFGFRSTNKVITKNSEIGLRSVVYESLNFVLD